jgi:hypothetical protein
MPGALGWGGGGGAGFAKTAQCYLSSQKAQEALLPHFCSSSVSECAFW